MYKPAPGIHPAAYLMGIAIFCLGVKRPGRDVENSPPFRPEVKNKWIYTFLPPMPSWNVQEQLYLLYRKLLYRWNTGNFVVLIQWIPVTFSGSVMFRSLKTVKLVCFKSFVSIILTYFIFSTFANNFISYNFFVLFSVLFTMREHKVCFLSIYFCCNLFIVHK